MLSEISQTEKNKYCMISSYAKSKKAKRVETESKMVATRGWGGGGIRQMLFKDTNLQQVVNKP